MHSFTDATGERWDIALSYGDILRIKSALGANLLEPVGKDHDSPLQRLVIDIEFMVNVGWLLVETQAKVRNVDQLGFATRLGGLALGHMQRAVLDELTDFFRSLGRTEMAEAIKRLLATVVEVTEQVRQRVAREGETLTEQVMAEVLKH